MVRKNLVDGLLTFDEDSPLFVKKKTTRKRKPQTTKSKPVEDVAPVEETKPKRRTRKSPTKKLTNSNAPKYIIKTPADCKHILPAFKKILAEKWKILETGNEIQAGNLSSYLRGVAGVAKNTRPKEYEELRILIALAKHLTKEKVNK